MTSATLYRLSRVADFKAIIRRHLAAFAARIKPDNDLASAVLQIQRVGVTLRAEAENSNGLALESCEIGVFVGVNFGGHSEEKVWPTSNLLCAAAQPCRCA